MHALLLRVFQQPQGAPIEHGRQWLLQTEQNGSIVRISLAPPPFAVVRSLAVDTGCKRRRVAALLLPDLWTLRGGLGSRGVLCEAFFTGAVYLHGGFWPANS
jgi:hypothetical protein